MSSRRIGVFLSVLLGYGAFLLLTCCGLRSAEAPASPEKPSVVLIVVDTLRADALTEPRNGQMLMPKLVRLASESIWYTRATSQSSWTKPAMVSVLTSLYPEVHNVQYGVHTKLTSADGGEVDVLPESLPAMATWFRKAGYNTAAVQANANLKGEFGFSQGFDSYTFTPYPEFRGRDVTDRAIDAALKADSPCFLYVHYMDPHHPYDPPEPYRREFSAEDTVSEEDLRLLGMYEDYYLDKVLSDVGIQSERKLAGLSPHGRQHVRSLYDGEVRYTDDEVARLIHAVREHDPRTIIIVTADHGEEFWEHGSVGHGKTVYEELIHVPLVLSVPGLPAARVDQPVETIDVLPTLAALAGLDAGAGWQGRNLRDYLGGESSTTRPVYSSTRTALREANVHLQSVTVWPNKLIVDNARGTQRLYDLSKDAQEEEDASKNSPDIVRTLRAHIDHQNMQAGEHPLSGAAQERMSLDSETIEQMQAIGYISGDSKRR